MVDKEIDPNQGRLHRNACFRQPRAVQWRARRCALRYLFVRRDALVRVNGRDLHLSGKNYRRDSPLSERSPATQFKTWSRAKSPTSVIQLLRRILAVDPTQRPASARDFMKALDTCRSRLGFIPSQGSKAQQTVRHARSPCRGSCGRRRRVFRLPAIAAETNAGYSQALRK